MRRTSVQFDHVDLFSMGGTGVHCWVPHVKHPVQQLAWGEKSWQVRKSKPDLGWRHWKETPSCCSLQACLVPPKGEEFAASFWREPHSRWRKSHGYHMHRELRIIGVVPICCLEVFQRVSDCGRDSQDGKELGLQIKIFGRKLGKPHSLLQCARPWCASSFFHRSTSRGVGIPFWLFRAPLSSAPEISVAIRI